MATFSQRIGRVPPKVAQIDSMDEDLRNGLWNAIDLYFFGLAADRNRSLVHGHVINVWLDHLRLKYSAMPHQLEDFAGNFRFHYYNKLNWHQAYDLVEAIAGHDTLGKETREECNRVLERENSAYRFVGSELAPIAHKSDQEAVEEAISASQAAVPTCWAHIDAALKLMASRTDPDFRNSIKESISAVEAVCQHLTGDAKATLAQALKRIPELHPALRDSLTKLYGYSSDGDGIRHALDGSAQALTVVDARFALVTCSAFCSYLLAKVSKAG